MFSIAASTTKSQSAAKFISVVPEILDKISSLVSSVIFPFETNFDNPLFILTIPL